MEFPWWSRGVPTYAHINKLMIITKGENHMQTNRKGKLERKKFYHKIAYYLEFKDA